MSDFAVFSTSSPPSLLYANGDEGQLKGRVKSILDMGDRPPDLFVDCTEGLILWYLRADHRTSATRTGYFIAAFRGDPETLRIDFSDALRDLFTDEAWQIPELDHPRWEAGFRLWRVRPGAAEIPNMDANITEVCAKNRPNQGTTIVDTPDYESALGILAELIENPGPCTAAIQSIDGPVNSEVDVVIRPGNTRTERNISPERGRFRAQSDSPPQASQSSIAESGIALDTLKDSIPPKSVTAAILIGATGIAILLAGFMTLLRGGGRPSLAILGTTGGLAVIGGFVGFERSSIRQMTHNRLTIGAVIFGLILLGIIAQLHARGVIRAGTVATVTAGVYLGIIGGGSITVGWRIARGKSPLGILSSLGT